jgi:hypothetical protein
MTQDQLYNVAISKADAKEKCQWLKIWNDNKNMKKENPFATIPLKGNDDNIFIFDFIQSGGLLIRCTSLDLWCNK